MLKDPFRKGKSWNPGWWTAVAIVIVAHVAIVYLLMGIKNPELHVGQTALFDMTEGAAAGAPEVFVEIQDFEEPPPPKLEEPIAVEEPEPEKADIVEEPPPPEKPKVPEKKPEPKKEKPKPKDKPKQKPKKKVEAKKPTGEQKVNPNAREGNSNASNDAQGTKGEGKDAYTAASHVGGYLSNPKPPYPADSIDNEEEGTVTLEVVVEPNGRPSSVKVIKSSGYRRLDQSAYKTVKERYKFTPATRFGTPVQSTYQFKIKFSLDDL